MNRETIPPSSLWKDEIGHVIVLGVAISEFDNSNYPEEISSRVIYRRVLPSGGTGEILHTCSVAAFQLRFERILVDIEAKDLSPLTNYAIEDGVIYE